MPTAPSLAIGGAPIQFAVVITNGTAITYENFTSVVSVGHCTCSSGPLALAPDGTLEVRQADGTWKTVFFDKEGGGMDYLGINEVGAVKLDSGASISFTFRIGLSASQAFTFTNGVTRLDVTLVNLADYTQIPGTSTGVPVQVTTA